MRDLGVSPSLFLVGFPSYYFMGHFVRSRHHSATIIFPEAILGNPKSGELTVDQWAGTILKAPRQRSLGSGI